MTSTPYSVYTQRGTGKSHSLAGACAPENSDQASANRCLSLLLADIFVVFVEAPPAAHRRGRDGPVPWSSRYRGRSGHVRSFNRSGTASGPIPLPSTPSTHTHQSPSGRASPLQAGMLTTGASASYAPQRVEIFPGCLMAPPHPCCLTSPRLSAHSSILFPVPASSISALRLSSY